MIQTGLAGKVVLITGTNNPAGIGAAIARAFAAEGAKPFLHFFRRPLEAAFKEPAQKAEKNQPGEALYRRYQTLTADAVLKEIREKGVQADSYEADLADPRTVPLLFDCAEEKLGPVEVLVNNAADWLVDTFVPSSGDIHTWHTEMLSSAPTPITAASHDRIFSVNSRAVALMMAEFARRHVKRGARWGRIINVSSGGASGAPSEVSYWASKYALESFSRSAAHELGSYGITVNIASPGPIQSGYITPELEAQLLPSIPLGRLGMGNDVADVIVFLASHQARWLTGQLLYVSGGHKML